MGNIDLIVHMSVGCPK